MICIVLIFHLGCLLSLWKTSWILSLNGVFFTERRHNEPLSLAIQSIVTETSGPASNLLVKLACTRLLKMNLGHQCLGKWGPALCVGLLRARGHFDTGREEGLAGLWAHPGVSSPQGAAASPLLYVAHHQPGAGNHCLTQEEYLCGFGLVE